MQIIDMNNCEYSYRHGRYGGQAGDKDGVLYNNENWIIKYLKSTKEMIDDIPEIAFNQIVCSSNRKEFYKSSLNIRFEKLIEPAYLKIMENTKKTRVA